MKAIRTHERTGVSGLVFEDAPEPKPMFCEVLVKVAACGITHNELDWPIWTCRAGHRRASVIPGHEVSGTVAALGFGTAGIAVGDEVYGLTDQLRDGAAAEYVAVEARNVAQKPRTVDHVHAAAVPRAGLTAWQALFDHGKLAKGQTVVIHGAGGGVGTLAVKLAVSAGARVIGTGRAQARELVLQLGAERYLDLSRDAFGDVKDVDVVFDLIGGDVLHQSWPMLRPGGTLVSVVDEPNDERADVKNLLFVVEPNGEQLTELARRIESLHPVVGKVSALPDGPRLWAEKIAGGIPGKVVLTSSSLP